MTITPRTAIVPRAPVEDRPPDFLGVVAFAGKFHVEEVEASGLRVFFGVGDSPRIEFLAVVDGFGDEGLEVLAAV